jgi:hypothetical protein
MAHGLRHAYPTILPPNLFDRITAHDGAVSLRSKWQLLGTKAVVNIPLRIPAASDTIGSVRRFAQMSITPTLTVAFAFVTVLIGVLFNNSRIGDLRAMTEKRFDDVNRHIDDKFALLAERIDRMNDNILRILADHDARLRKLEKID